jgi:hypothetical protein
MFVVRSIEELAFQKPDAFRDFVLQQPHSVFDYGLYTEATNALAHSLDYTEVKVPEIPTGADPWGKPFWVNISFTGVANDDLGQKVQVCRIVLWSSGPNKENEQGSGDDIVFGPFEVKIR